MLAEPEGDQQWEADLLLTGILGDPRRERLPPGGRDRVRPAVAPSRRPGLDEAPVLEQLQLAVDVARRDIPKALQPGRDLLQQVPARLGALVEEAQERALGVVEVGHLSLTFPSGGLCCVCNRHSLGEGRW